MEESIIDLINFCHPNESSKFEGIENLQLTWKYTPALPPNYKKIRIFIRIVRLKDLEVPKATLCIVHGFAEHSGKHTNTAAYFALRGFEVHLIDLRSYGYSGGARAGHDLIEFQRDIHLMLKNVREDIPCFLWGHSMGGLLVSTLCMNNPSLNISGLIVSSPLYQSSSAEINCIKESMMSGVADILKEGVFNSFIAPSCLSKDDIFIRHMFNDTKLIPLFSPGLGLSMFKHMKYAMQYAQLLKQPVIFFHGDADILTFSSATEKVFKKATSNDKTFKLVPNGYHELHHDTERDSFIQEAFEWVNARVKGNPLGKVPDLKIGFAGLPKKSNRWRNVIITLVIIYFIIGWKVKAKINFVKIMSITKYLAKIFWPLALVLS